MVGKKCDLELLLPIVKIIFIMNNISDIILTIIVIIIMSLFIITIMVITIMSLIIIIMIIMIMSNATRSGLLAIILYLRLTPLPSPWPTHTLQLIMMMIREACKKHDLFGFLKLQYPLPNLD